MESKRRSWLAASLCAALCNLVGCAESGEENPFGTLDASVGWTPQSDAGSAPPSLGGGDPDSSSGSIDSGTYVPPAEAGAGVGDAGRNDAGPGPQLGDGGLAKTKINEMRKFMDWTYYEVEGAKCRNGSPAGYYLRKGKNAEGNLMIFFNGGGVCYDDFLCGFNPQSVDESMPGETIQNATLELFSNLQVLKVAQQPVEEGIFKRDAKNPVGDWNMVYIPYCTGDIFAGTKPDTEIPNSILQGKQQLVGYNNTMLMLPLIKQAFPSPKQVLVTGVSAGGMATLVHYDNMRETFKGADVLAISDSGIPFRDQWMAVCLQKNWRAMWGMNNWLPKDCSNCFRSDGGGLVEGLGGFIFKQKYKGQFLGGGVSTKQDQIIKLFFGMGNDNCTASSTINGVGAFFTLSSLPPEVFPAGLKDFIENVAGKDQVGSYIMEGDLHQHIFRPRFYEQNGVGITLADWVGKILKHEAVHVGAL